MTTELIPLADRIVIEDVKDAERTEGGLYIPDSAMKANTSRATVISMGGGALLSSGARVSPEVSIGDIVLYQRMAGLEIKVNHKSYKVITERDIIGIIRES